jgi:hypothetical protein
MAYSYRRADAITLAKELQRLRRSGLDADTAARQLGVTSRHARRICRLLELPDPIQVAVRQGELPATVALNLFSLPWAARDEIANRIQAGERARTVVAEFIATTPRPPRRYIPRIGASVVQAQLRARLRVFGSEYFDVYRNKLERKFGPDHRACKQLAAAADAADEIGRRLAKAAEHVRSLMATSPFLLPRNEAHAGQPTDA